MQQMYWFPPACILPEKYSIYVAFIIIRLITSSGMLY